MSARLTPTARSVKFLADAGWTVDLCERRIPGTNISKDLFGIADLVALRGRDVMLVQVTSSTNVAHRVHKIAQCPHLYVIREANIGIVVHGWRRNARGEWTLRVVDVS